MQKNPKNRGFGSQNDGFASVSLEAEIPRFSDKNQKNSKNA